MFIQLSHHYGMALVVIGCDHQIEMKIFYRCSLIRKNIFQLVSAFQSLDGELKGDYYPLEGMDKATQQRLIDDHFLFKEGDRFLQAARACEYWPTGKSTLSLQNVSS